MKERNFMAVLDAIGEVILKRDGETLMSGYELDGVRRELEEAKKEIESLKDKLSEQE